MLVHRRGAQLPSTLVGFRGGGAAGTILAIVVTGGQKRYVVLSHKRKGKVRACPLGRSDDEWSVTPDIRAELLVARKKWLKEQ